MKLTGTNSSIGLIILIAYIHLWKRSRMSGPAGLCSSQARRTTGGTRSRARALPGQRDNDAGKAKKTKPASQTTCALPTWWSWRGGCTRSHSEHGRETPQRRWYFVSRRGRVGRCQVCQTHVVLSQYLPVSTRQTAATGPTSPFSRKNGAKSPQNGPQTSRPPGKKTGSVTRGGAAR